MDLEDKGFLKFAQVEQLLNKMGVFQLVGDSTSTSKKALLLVSDVAKQRFLSEQIFAIEFFKTLNEDFEDFLLKEQL